MKKTQPLSFDVDHTFTLRDHSDMHTTSSTPEVVVSAWEGNVSVTVRSKDNPKIVYGEVYVELYAGELAVNVYDEEHYGGEGDRFTLSRFDTAPVLPDEPLGDADLFEHDLYLFGIDQDRFVQVRELGGDRVLTTQQGRAAALAWADAYVRGGYAKRNA